MAYHDHDVRRGPRYPNPHLEESLAPAAKYQAAPVAPSTLTEKSGANATT
jgi:hypothetical protein